MVKTTLSELNHADNPSANTEYDWLDRLIQWRRGTLDGEKDGLSGGASKYQTFTLESPGNPDWSGARTHGSASVSSVNQITAIAASSAHVGYDLAGNMSSGDTLLNLECHRTESAVVEWVCDSLNRPGYPAVRARSRRDVGTRHESGPRRGGLAKAERGTATTGVLPRKIRRHNTQSAVTQAGQRGGWVGFRQPDVATAPAPPGPAFPAGWGELNAGRLAANRLRRRSGPSPSFCTR